MFRESLALAPDRASIHKDLAYTLLKVGETKRAGDEFAEALRLDPEDRQVALEYAFLCYETNQKALAAACLIAFGRPETRPHRKLSRI